MLEGLCEYRPMILCCLLGVDEIISLEKISFRDQGFCGGFVVEIVLMRAFLDSYLGV